MFRRSRETTDRPRPDADPKPAQADAGVHPSTFHEESDSAATNVM